MIAKAAVAGGAVVPVVWTILGYQFEAASMIAGLSACLMVRVWVSLTDKSRGAWAIDVVVTGISLLFTAGTIVMRRPEPFYALLTGTGLGAMGAGIIAAALMYVRKLEVFVGVADADEVRRPVSDADTAAGIKAAMVALNPPIDSDTAP